MNNFYIITNTAKDPDMKLTNKLLSILESCGKRGVLAPEDITEEIDCVLVLGGDGTLLKAATDFVDLDVPFLGINLGTLGFMTEVETGSMEAAVKAVTDGAYEVEERMMLYGNIILKKGESFTFHALNDIVLTRKGSLRIVSYDIYVNGQFLNSYKADGVIISTPTGSTGYNMSAGGPIIEPKAKILLMTPICPHTLNARSIILSPDDEIEIRITEGRNGENQEMEINFDGSLTRSLQTGDSIKISRSERVTKFIRLSRVSFLQILNKKFSD